MGKALRFHAADDDLMPVLSVALEKHPVRIYPVGRVNENPPQSIAREHMQIGTTQVEQQGGCAYLFLPEALEIQIRTYDLAAGGQVSTIDQLLNNESVVLCPAGRRPDNVVIAGTIDTAWDSAFATRFLRTVEAGLRKHFVKSRAFWVGPKALAILRSGGRLTHAMQSPRAYDLREEDPARTHLE